MSRLVEGQYVNHPRTVRLYDRESPLQLDLGDSLFPVDVTFETYGALNPGGTNCVLICHALTGNAHAAGRPDEHGQVGWWDALIGPGRTFDTDELFVVCPNILGSCYGTTGPSSQRPDDDAHFGPDFPAITVRDIVRVQHSLLKLLGVNRLRTVVGSSLGGMQVLEWGIMFPDMCDSLIPISAAVAQPAWCIGLNTISRAAITGDPAWKSGWYSRQPEHGLALARMVGMISYRTPEEYEERFGRTLQEGSGFRFSVESYLHYQGRKLVDRFDANSYIVLSRATDAHDVARDRATIQEVLGEVRTATLSIGFSSDIRYLPRHQREIADLIPGGRYAEVESTHGHDGFLIDIPALDRSIRPFLSSSAQRRRSA